MQCSIEFSKRNGLRWCKTPGECRTTKAIHYRWRRVGDMRVCIFSPESVQVQPLRRMPRPGISCGYARLTFSMLRWVPSTQPAISDRERPYIREGSATVVLPGMISTASAPGRLARTRGAYRLGTLGSPTLDAVVHRHTYRYRHLCRMNRFSKGRSEPLQNTPLQGSVA